MSQCLSFKTGRGLVYVTLLAANVNKLKDTVVTDVCCNFCSFRSLAEDDHLATWSSRDGETQMRSTGRHAWHAPGGSDDDAKRNQHVRQLRVTMVPPFETVFDGLQS